MDPITLDFPAGVVVRDATTAAVFWLNKEVFLFVFHLCATISVNISVPFLLFLKKSTHFSFIRVLDILVNA